MPAQQVQRGVHTCRMVGVARLAQVRVRACSSHRLTLVITGLAKAWLLIDKSLRTSPGCT